MKGREGDISLREEGGRCHLPPASSPFSSAGQRVSEKSVGRVVAGRALNVSAITGLSGVLLHASFCDNQAVSMMLVLCFNVITQVLLQRQ